MKKDFHDELHERLEMVVLWTGKSKGKFASDGGSSGPMLSRIFNGTHSPDKESFQQLLDGNKIPDALQLSIWEAYLNRGLPAKIAQRLQIGQRPNRADYQHLATGDLDSGLRKFYLELDPTMREALAYFAVHGQEARHRATITELYFANVDR